MSTMLVLLVAACGGETANEPAGETTAERTATEGQVALSDLPKAPPAPRDAVAPRLRGSQEMTLKEFVRAVVFHADGMWQGIFEEAGGTYSNVDFRAFDQSVDACETTLDQTFSPLYCELDQTVYWPVDWVVPTSGKTLAEYGDFAVAVAAAHEVGHHVQNQLGILEAEDTGQLETRSLQTELQADCFAGVWGYSAYYEGLVESGDLDEAIGLFWHGGIVQACSGILLGTSTAQNRRGVIVPPCSGTSGHTSDGAEPAWPKVGRRCPMRSG
jgi:predicted metalloprotease